MQLQTSAKNKITSINKTTLQDCWIKRAYTPGSMNKRPRWVREVYAADEDDIMWYAVAVNGRLDVNVALNRPAYQTSVYSDNGGTYPANHANDGNHHTDMWDTGTCAVTDPSTNPWWAVDLLVPLHVLGVKFTNRNAWGTYTDIINK